MSKDPSNINWGSKYKPFCLYNRNLSHRVFLRPNSIWENLNMLTQKRVGEKSCVGTMTVLSLNLLKIQKLWGGPPEQAWASLENSERRKSPTLRQSLWFMKHQVRWSDNTPHLTVRKYLLGQRIVIPICSQEWVYQMPFCKILRKTLPNCLREFNVPLFPIVWASHLFPLAEDPEHSIIKCSFTNFFKRVCPNPMNVFINSWFSSLPVHLGRTSMLCKGGSFPPVFSNKNKRIYRNFSVLLE